MNHHFTSTTRIKYLDFLKFIGISGIIFAHVGSPKLVLMLRSFDVPLMVCVSAILSERSYSKNKTRNQSGASYCISRFKRLVFPTWIFLTFYFVLYFVLSEHSFDAQYYLASYALTHFGIQYVWVILIYLYCALLVPIFDKMGYSSKSIAIIAAAYFFGIGTQNKVILSTIYYIVPYGTVAFIGYNYTHFKQNVKCAIMCAACIIFVIAGSYYWISSGSPQLVSIAKFPPRFYYLGYGIACSFALIMLCEKRHLKLFENKLIKYISIHSLWIYLWHILTLTIYDVLHFPSVWIVKYVLVYASAIIATLFVNKFLDIVESKHHFAIFKYLRG